MRGIEAATARRLGLDPGAAPFLLMGDGGERMPAWPERGEGENKYWVYVRCTCKARLTHPFLRLRVPQAYFHVRRGAPTCRILVTPDPEAPDYDRRHRVERVARGSRTEDLIDLRIERMRRAGLAEAG